MVLGLLFTMGLFSLAAFIMVGRYANRSFEAAEEISELIEVETHKFKMTTTENVLENTDQIHDEVREEFNEDPNPLQASLASEGVPGVKMIGMPTARERFEQRIRIDQEMRNAEYELKVASMDKVTLLDEMIRFQDEQMRSREPSREQLIRGRILFQALLRTAETEELRKLSGDYKTRLEDEYKSSYWAG